METSGGAAWAGGQRGVASVDGRWRREAAVTEACTCQVTSPVRSPGGDDSRGSPTGRSPHARSECREHST